MLGASPRGSLRYAPREIRGDGRTLRGMLRTFVLRLVRLRAPARAQRSYYERQLWSGEAAPFSEFTGRFVEFVYHDGSDSTTTATGLLLGSAGERLQLACGPMLMEMDAARLVRMSDYRA